MVTTKIKCLKESKNERGNTVKVFDSPFYTITTEENKMTILVVNVKPKKRHYPSVFYHHVFGEGWQQEVRFPCLKKLTEQQRSDWLNLCHYCEIDIRTITELINNIQDMKGCGGIYYVN